MASKDIIKYQWETGQSGNMKGRPRKFVSTLVDYGYSKTEIVVTIETILAFTTSELETFIALEECTILEKIIAKALLKSSATGSLYALDILLNRTQGLPRQETEITLDNHIFMADFGNTNNSNK